MRAIFSRTKKTIFLLFYEFNSAPLFNAVVNMCVNMSLTVLTVRTDSSCYGLLSSSIHIRQQVRSFRAN